MKSPTGASCPLPIEGSADRITLAHGEGGRLMRALIRQRITSVLAPHNQEFPDAATLGDVGGDLAVTTDSFVVDPLFFPGGDIGSLAVFGTVNDLAVAGAKPLALTLSLIIEEGLSIETLDRVIESTAAAARQCEVQVVAGDTKVVPRGAADRLFLNTAGIGKIVLPAPPGPSQIREEDLLIVSGPIGQHGIAVMADRDDLGFKPPPKSDSAPLHEITSALQSAAGEHLVAMRDATRGGVAAVLHEWAEASGKTMRLTQSTLPVASEVQGACELLGLDPLHVANEGTFVVAVRREASDLAVSTLRSFSQSAGATVIGSVIPEMNTAVVIEGLLGSLLPIDEPAGAPLPRIC